MRITRQLLDITFALILRRHDKVQGYDSLITFMSFLLFYPNFAHILNLPSLKSVE